MTDNEHDRASSLADRARSALSNVGQSERVKRAAAVTMAALAARTGPEAGHGD